MSAHFFLALTLFQRNKIWKRFSSIKALKIESQRKGAKELKRSRSELVIAQYRRLHQLQTGELVLLRRLERN